MFLPDDAVDPSRARRIIEHVEVMASAFAPLTRRALWAALDVVNVSGLRRARPLSGLPVEARRSAVEALGHRSALFRRLVGSVRDVLVVAYFDQPEVKDRLGYRPDEWTVAMTRARDERWGEEIEQHERFLRTPLARPPL